MNIDFNKLNHGSLLSFLITEACATDDLIVKDSNFDPSKLDVKLSINGQDRDIEAVFKLIEEQFGKLIVKKATEMMEEKFSVINNKVGALRVMVEDTLDQELNKQ